MKFLNKTYQKISPAGVHAPAAVSAVYFSYYFFIGF